MTDTTRPFPSDFVWGSATAAYQVEGAVSADGRGWSIWDTFSHTPGRTHDGDTGDVACDHYHRMREDIALMAELGIPSYRFSVAWPRVLPAGTGEVETRGLDFYSRLVDTLLEFGIRPLVTLYHWDLPQALSDQGGWTTRATSEAFADYATVVAGRLGDRVEDWLTLNEPWCSAYLGYEAGEHAPGVRDAAAARRALHHLNLAHGLGVQALRAALPSAARVGVTLNLAQLEVATDSPADVSAHAAADAVANRAFLEPMLRGTYPTGYFDEFGWTPDADDLADIHQPLDYLGVNYYTTETVAAALPDDPRGRFLGAPDVVTVPQPGPTTAMGWLVQPAGLTRLLRRVHDEYPDTPLLITENGAACPDAVGEDGVVHDGDRIVYLQQHLGAVLDAIDAGVDVRGYFVWSLLDNFEWAEGYAKRFGLVRTDYETLRRVPKDSARWYRDVVSANAL